MSLPGGEEVGTVGTPAPLRPWTDDRGWISDIVQAATPDAKLATLFSWVIAAGGWISGTTALLPPLPHRLATRELHRILRQSGIAISEETPR